MIGVDPQILFDNITQPLDLALHAHEIETAIFYFTSPSDVQGNKYKKKCKCNLYVKSVYQLQETRATEALG